MQTVSVTCCRTRGSKCAFLISDSLCYASTIFILSILENTIILKAVEKYGPEKGVVDITTRQTIQLRGVKLEDGPAIIDGLHARNQTSFQSALDNVRNMVGSPLAGIDDQEMVDTRELCEALNDLICLDPVTGTRGNPYWGNLPRKFNIAVSGSRDDYAHTHISKKTISTTDSIENRSYF